MTVKVTSFTCIFCTWLFGNWKQLMLMQHSVSKWWENYSPLTFTDYCNVPSMLIAVSAKYCHRSHHWQVQVWPHRWHNVWQLAANSSMNPVQVVYVRLALPYLAGMCLLVSLVHRWQWLVVPLIKCCYLVILKLVPYIMVNAASPCQVWWPGSLLPSIWNTSLSAASFCAQLKIKLFIYSLLVWCGWT